MEKQKKYYNKGITLIALVITIIVLLILAGVSISLVVGDNGVLTQSKQASVKTNQKAADETVEMSIASINSEFMGNILTSNANAKMIEFATQGKISKQIKDYGYEIKINGQEVEDDNGTSITGGERISLNKIGNQNVYEYMIDVTDTSLKASNAYVSNGLMLHYDGINNSSNGHSSTITSWKNLVSNTLNGTISGATWENNCLVFDGADDYVSIGEMNYSNITIEAVYELNTTYTSGEHCIICNFENGGYGLNFSYVDGASFMGKNRFQVSVSNEWFEKVGSTNDLQVGKKYGLSGSYDGNTMILWENGVKYSNPITDTIKYPYNSTYMMLGANPTGSNPQMGFCSMKLYSVRIYNRALTDEEVQKNYLIDKTRFNID